MMTFGIGLIALLGYALAGGIVAVASVPLLGDLERRWERDGRSEEQIDARAEFLVRMAIAAWPIALPGVLLGWAGFLLCEAVAGASSFARSVLRFFGEFGKLWREADFELPGRRKPKLLPESAKPDSQQGELSHPEVSGGELSRPETEALAKIREISALTRILARDPARIEVVREAGGVTYIRVHDRPKKSRR